MARGGVLSLQVDTKSVERMLQVSLARVERGTKKATTAACEELKKATLAEVPRGTGNLASSFYYDIHGKYRGFSATLGYGRGGGVVNGKRAADYMVAVHENLQAHHANGKAKFLEDPLRAYESKFREQLRTGVRSELT